VTRTILRTTIRKKLGEATAAFWEDSELNQWIEDAQLDIAWKCRCKRQRSLTTSVASTVRYTLSSLVSNCLRIFKVRIYDSSTTKWLPLDYATQDDLDRDYPGWESADASTPIKYVYDVELNEFILYPKADSNHVGTNYLEIYNCPKPTAIANDAAEPDIPTVLHLAVIEYVVATGLETRGYQDIADTHWKSYDGKVVGYMNQRDIEEDEEIQMRPV
jgi:hypothetical protein